ncbi:MAG: hypothetical protein IT361_11380 [Gemmatimonadaceae bacterium]|nr:hypothetical protein [Gemmatimonadaceae bacterium]
MTNPTTPTSAPSRLAGLGFLNGHAVKRRGVLAVQPPPEVPEGFVARSIIAIGDAAGGDATVARVDRKLKAEGLVEAVGKATAKLNIGGLDRTQRLLLSIPAVYANILEKGLAVVEAPGASEATLSTARRRTVNFDDTAGLVDFVLRGLDATDGLRAQYATRLVDAVVKARGLSLADSVKTEVVREVAAREIPIPVPKVEELVVSLIALGRSTLTISDAIDSYVARGEVEAERFTPAIRKRMIAYLKDLGVAFPDGGLTSGDRSRFDEYFALAYNHATRAGGGATTDPIDNVRQRGAINDWDFTVDTFDAVEEQGVVPQNILAAGALDYVYELGERLGMFRLADALVLRWANGTFDAEPGRPSADLYRYWKLRSERVSPEERAMMYRRILSKGDGNLLSGMVENEAFPDLWGALMEKATDFLRRSEENASTDRLVSRQPIHQATKQLQYNLTEHATGMAHMQITEMYHHLLEAKQVLEHAIPFFSTGSRKSLWTVIERASREWFNESPNISAIRSAAVDGNKVYQWIANFDQSSVTDQQFQVFLEASEAWIIAQATDDSAPSTGPEMEDEDEADIDAELNDTDDWDK